MSLHVEQLTKNVFLNRKPFLYSHFETKIVALTTKLLLVVRSYRELQTSLGLLLQSRIAIEIMRKFCTSLL